MAHDEAVIAWVTDRTVEGWPAKRIVAALEQGEGGWPLNDGRSLSDGSLAEVRAVIGDRERRETQAEAPRRRRTASKRKAQITAERKAENDSDLIWAQLQIVKQTGILESTDLAECGLDEQGVTEDTMRRIFDDLADLQSWMDYSQSVIAARLSEISVREKIKALRTKTTANGCTSGEEGSARRLADKLERRLDARLPA